MEHRISAIALDEKSVISRTPAIEQEREVAISDLLETNRFKPKGSSTGPYRLALSVKENRLVFDIARESGTRVGRILLSLSPFRGIIKDYFLMCENYYEAIKHASSDRLQTLDMARRAVHNEGSEMLQTQLSDKLAMDFDTARRLFTLICVLHMKG